MKTYSFYKYQGTGNDFVIIDNRENVFNSQDLDLVINLCDRKFGIGADGLILIENHIEYDFNLIYFNADGSKSFCGNGSRCGVAFAKLLGIINTSTTFMAIDGVHEALINHETVKLKMKDVERIEYIQNNFFIDTGSPHFIVYQDDISNFDLVASAHKIRYNERFIENGTNVNFVSKKEDILSIRTYERGVEGETLSCGTGATAVALSAFIKHNLTPPVSVNVRGGTLQIDFKANDNNHFTNIWLIGEAKKVYQGEITI